MMRFGHTLTNEQVLNALPLSKEGHQMLKEYIASDKYLEDIIINTEKKNNDDNIETNE